MGSIQDQLMTEETERTEEATERTEEEEEVEEAAEEEEEVEEAEINCALMTMNSQLFHE